MVVVETLGQATRANGRNGRAVSLLAARMGGKRQNDRSTREDEERAQRRRAANARAQKLLEVQNVMINKIISTLEVSGSVEIRGKRKQFHASPSFPIQHTFALFFFQIQL